MKVEYFPEGMNWGMSKYDPEWERTYHTDRLDQLRSGPTPSMVECFARDGETAEDCLAWEIKHHSVQLAKAEKVLAEGPKPSIQTLLFPEKSVVITAIYPTDEVRIQTTMLTATIAMSTEVAEEFARCPVHTFVPYLECQECRRG